MKDPIKVYDARWEVSEFNDNEVKRLFEATLAYARLLEVDTIAFTRDARLGCARVLEIGVDTALHMGFRVYACFDPVSTPQGYYVALKTSLEHQKTMGLMVTASHNPAQYIGVKFTVPTVQAIGFDCGPLNGLTKVREIYHSDQKFEKVSGGELHLVEHPTQSYIEYSLKTAGIQKGDLKGLSVVLDAFNGSAGPEIYQALTEAGATVYPLRLVPNGYFPTGSPNPTSQNKMDEAIALAKEKQADVVLGVDGDGDRMVFGDTRGILNAGFVTVPILKTLLEDEGVKNPSVLYDPKVNPLALAEWGKLNVKPVLFRNGHSQIKDYMLQIGALAAAEESGHYYHQITMENLTIAGENSILTILLFLGAIKKQANVMDELWALQDQVFTTGEFNYEFESDDIRDQAITAVIDHFKSDGAETVTETEDGIDLQGTVVSKGVSLEIGNVALSDKWYSGYFRIATNEKGVVRSYLSTGDHSFGKELESEVRKLLEEKFNGKVIE